MEGYRLFMEKDDNELFQEARKLFEKRDYAGVVKTVGLVAQAGRRDLGLARILVLSYSAVGRHDLALEWSEKALQENPEDDEVSRIVAAIRNSFEPDANTSENERSSRWATALPRETLKQIQSGVHRMKYRGIQMLKNPFDIAIYMQLIWNLKPGTIFEIGTHSGGAATWFGDLLANYGLPGRVISIDLLKPTGVVHPRVTFLNGDARVLEEVLDRNFLESSPHPWLVIEDSSHEIVTSEAAWRFFHPFFSPGDYLVIEAGIISDLYPDAYPHYSSGPHVAIRRLLAEFSDLYQVDRYYCDFFGHNFTWCTNGFIRRK